MDQALTVASCFIQFMIHLNFLFSFWFVTKAAANWNKILTWKECIDIPFAESKSIACQNNGWPVFLRCTSLVKALSRHVPKLLSFSGFMTIARGAVTRHLGQANWAYDYAWLVSCETASITFPLSSSAAHQQYATKHCLRMWHIGLLTWDVHHTFLMQISSVVKYRLLKVFATLLMWKLQSLACVVDNLV